MKTILITGGTGFIGKELCELLLREGNNVIIVTRFPEKYESIVAKNQRFVNWEKSNLVNAMNESDAVINLAGESIFGERWTHETKKRIYDSRIDTTRKLVGAIQESDNKPDVFVSSSASGIYGNHEDKILDENENPASDFLAKVCIDWEKESQKASEFGVKVVNPRIGIVLEEGGGALEKMIPPFQFFVGGPIGNGEQYMSWIHRSDLCRALLYPIFSEIPQGPYNVCSPYPATMNEFAETLGKVMNRPSFFRVPLFALNIAFGEAAKPISDSIRMQPKVLQLSDFEFEYENLEEALAEIVS